MASALKLYPLALVACTASGFDPTAYARDKEGVVENLEPSVPPACYQKAGASNPCYVCHAGGYGPNTLDDADLQADYAFSDYARENHWTNLFVDRRAAIAATPEAEILAYVRQDNYRNVRDLDLSRGFDDDGLARDGSGWRAYRYVPLPGGFGFDDGFIRLPAKFRTSRADYLRNLAILEQAIAHTNPDAPGDLPSHYVGGAADVPVEVLVYPVGTELLHSVRYLDPDAPTGMARRMKELRYMKKEEGPDASARLFAYEDEAAEKDEGLRPKWQGDAFEGLLNIFGWRLQGWIEDERGRLRLQSDEEHRFCMGCHQSLGVTIDSTFSFARATGWGPPVARAAPDAREAALWLERTGAPIDPPRTRDEIVALDVAYREIVKEQSFVRGRDAVVAPSTNSWQRIDGVVTGAAHTTYRDARLQLSQ